MYLLFLGGVGTGRVMLSCFSGLSSRDSALVSSMALNIWFIRSARLFLLLADFLRSRGVVTPVAGLVTPVAGLFLMLLSLVLLFLVSMSLMLLMPASGIVVRMW